MELQNLVYLLLLLSYLVVPVALSISSKIRFTFRLRYILPAILFCGAIFIMWDIRFTQLAIWTYNPDYLTGITLLKIPIEKWLSLLVIPLSAAYIYEWIKSRNEKPHLANIFLAISLILLVILGILTYIYRQNMFSFFTFFLTTIYLGYTIFRNRFKKHYYAFYSTFFISLLPFVIVSALLGSLPVMAYSAQQVMGMAFLGIPIEKFAYLFLMLLISLTIYEYLNERRYY